MTKPDTDQTQRSPVARLVRRTVGAALVGVVFFAALWMTVFNAMTAALVSSGATVLLIGGSSVSETFQSIFEVVAEVILGIFGAIADFFSSLFS